MPLILKKKTDRAAVQIAHADVLRTSDEVIRQLQDQLDAERAQHAFNCAEYEKQIALLLRDLAEAKYGLARRDALASAPSPSAMIH